MNVSIPVHDPTDVAEARRAAATLARSLALDSTIAGQVAIVVTEAATNLLKHGGGGSMLLTQCEQDGIPAVEMLAIDKGRGMDSIGRSMVDGYSTAGSPGNGLGAIARLSSFHQIYSSPGLGTVVLARISAARPGSPSPRLFDVGAVSVPKFPETVCGDAWLTQPSPHGMRVLLADGLGHGFGAAEAANTALRIAIRYPSERPLPLLQLLHDGLRATRGAAISVAEIDCRAGQVTYAGLGNVAGSVVAEGEPRRQMVSYNGTAGHQSHKIRDFTYSYSPTSTVILHSDGLATHWSIEKYPGLLRHHPSIVAAVLYRDFQRGNDDATVVVVRAASELQ